MGEVAKRTLVLVAIVATAVAVWVVAVVMVQTWRIVPLTNGSMTPTYPEGSICFVERNGDYEKGDVITFVDSHGLAVTHRLIDYEEDGSLRTQGDANGAADYHRESLRDEDVIGLVRFGLTPREWGGGLAVIMILTFAIIFIRRAFKSKSEDDSISNPA